MAKEIERKFLVLKKPWKTTDRKVKCWQGYLAFDPVTVRVRTMGPKAFLTIKGRTKGFTRDEFEFPIPLKQANELLTSLCGRPVEKVRHYVKHKGHLWEVDEFQGDNKGLIIAEIELISEREKFDRPAWLGNEVTDDHRYYNSHLSKHPYKGWDK
ncbi:MAG: CYTH domain-containing protein [Verrucomicrobiota bacterium]|nr:CYTH domain-containing protein [Verrucomicrobiota bacterium]